MSEREYNMRCARVYLAQVPLFRHRGNPFAFVLLEWAAHARKLAADECRPKTAQADLFA